MKLPKWLTRSEKRSTPGPWEDYWYTPTPFENSSGVDVTEETALRYSTVWACRRVISEDLASLPLHIYRRIGESKERAREHELYPLLHDAPNKWMSAMQFRETLEDHLLSYGNAYAEIQRNLRGGILALIPLNPAKMEPQWDDDEQLVFKYRLENGQKHTFQQQDVFHLHGYSFNGLIGHSPIQYAAELVGCGLSAQQLQGTNYKTGGRLQLAFSHPAPKAPNQAGRDNFKKELRKEYGGTSGQRIAVLWEGMKVEPISMTMEDAQFIESRKLNRTEICAIFRVPPHKIMDLERATFSNIEQQSISYVSDTIRPWAVRWEQAINQQLLGGTGEYYAEHNLEGLMRGDVASRYAAYAVGRQWSWLTVNEIRALENMNPVEGGDTRLEPLNMVSIDEDGEKDQPMIPAGKPSAAEIDAPITDEEKERAALAIRRLRLIRS